MHAAAQSLDKTSAEPNATSILLGHLPVAVYTTDAEGHITYYNDAAAELWGCRPSLAETDWCGSWRLYWPDGTPMRHDECPMAIALKERRPIRGEEAIAERPNGERVPFLAYPSPILDEKGQLIGGINMLVDISERKEIEERAQRYEAIVASSEDAIVSKSLDGTVLTWNRGAEHLFGYRADDIVGKSIAVLIPADRQDEEPRILEGIRKGERVDHFETLRQRKDGSIAEISLTVSPVRDKHGRIVGVSKIARDISERKRAREQQQLILREMGHRVKNVFAIASGFATSAARSAVTTQEMAAVIRQRLGALARAHSLVRPEWTEEGAYRATETTLLSLLQAIVSPYEGVANPISLVGPAVNVGAQSAPGVAMALHELATNSVKYGALSSSAGVVAVRWELQDENVNLSWTERGGPQISGMPKHEGFGTLLARRTITDQLRGKIAFQWDAEGLSVDIDLPLESLAR